MTAEKITSYYSLLLLFIFFGSYTVTIMGAENCVTSRWAVSMRKGMRETIEDRFIVKIDREEEFYGVYDGHAGSKAVDFAEKYLHENFSAMRAEKMKKRPSMNASKIISESLIEAFLKTDKDFLEKHKEDYSGAAVTVAVVDSPHRKLFFTNCGDSRAILVRNGKMLFSTEDHVPNLPKERSRIEKAGGFVDCFFECQRKRDNSIDPPRGSDYDPNRCKHPACVNGELEISRAIGDGFVKNSGVIAEPVINEMPIEKDDVIILASDGLWNVMKNEEVVACMKN